MVVCTRNGCKKEFTEGENAEGAVLTLSGALDVDEFLQALIAHKAGKGLDSADKVLGGQEMTSC